MAPSQFQDPSLWIFYSAAMFLNLCYGHHSMAKRLQDKLSKTKPSRAVKYMKFFLMLSETTVVLFPVIQLLLLTYSPCTPPFIMSIFPNCEEIMEYSQAKGWSDIKGWLSMVVHGFEVWMTVHMVYAGNIWLTYIVITGIVCILEYLRILER
ncbi:hypothetical protein Fcan01_00813 [Folsomia candida]|uniref:Uncharacterized protein n=1 Tax=Folsomia candida TaxID=158441 RepID=A0A226EUN6_FOLCA|nr:hypothetical protein Fcan01_00813 [Folsomia candida]